MKKIYEIFITLTLIFYSCEAYSQIEFNVERITFYHLEDEPNVINDDGCIGPGLFIDGFVKNISNDTLKINTIGADFYLVYSYKGINYIKKMILFSFGGLQELIKLEPHSTVEFSLESKDAFIPAFDILANKNYLTDIQQIIPTLKVIYLQTLNHVLYGEESKVNISQPISEKSIKYSFD
jgi:hypothetical protein